MGIVFELQKLEKEIKADKTRVAVVKAADEEVLDSIKRGLDDDIIYPILIDDAQKLKKQLAQFNISESAVEIVDEADDKKAAEIGVKLAREKQVDVLMKGFLGTGDLLRPVVNREEGIRSSKLLSHVAVLYVSKLNRLLAITDGGMVTKPDKEQLQIVAQHGAQVMQSVGVDHPKVSFLSASENVIRNYETSVWAKELTEEQTEEDFTVEGPLSLDLSLIPEIAKQKGYTGKVQGDADVIVTPDITSGNSLAKSLTLFGDSEMAGLIIGASVPIVLTSRSSSSDEKYSSILLARHFMNQ